MRRLCLVVVCMLALSGCGAVETMETISDDVVVPVMKEAAQVQLVLPDLDDTQVIEDGIGGRIYLCDGYSVTVQTLDGGDLYGTLESVSGFDADKLTVLKTERSSYSEARCAWSAVGEGENIICRAVILDDGCYHYAVTVMADASRITAQPDLWDILDTVEISIG